ncbi:porin [Paraburkholderia sartisoli]|uniref:Outer membrane protein (Porin) n=1 Tax=Paraburkholderia sartisoli TaxID=83784 RepID=A0A1H4D5L4_9BURK|nr:porin [Paraburkholderia sartisoli]SEA67582.1 Outer membrane protein (porin) [Paraburkholderia sartisoli]
MKLKYAPFPVLGIAVALTVPSAAFAQSSITLYGIIDAAVQYGNTGGRTTIREDSSAVAPSRWGLTGKEDLGGGYAAVFKLEDGFNVNSGAIAGNGALFNREAWVGIKGPFGQVQLGNNYTPVFTTYVTYSQGELNTLGWGNAANNYVFIPVARTANSIRYVSSPVAGFTLRALYARGTNGTSGMPGTLGDTLSAGVNFKVGQFSADADYLQQRFANTATITSQTEVQTGKYYVFGASYDFGFVKPAVLYQIHRNAAGVDTSISSAYASPDHDFYEVNALIPNIVGGTVLVSFGQYLLKSNGSGDSTSYAVRYDYHLSKRTGVYVGISEVRNHSSASFSVSDAAGPGIPVAAGKNLTAGIVGMVHKF